MRILFVLFLLFMSACSTGSANQYYTKVGGYDHSELIRDKRQCEIEANQAGYTFEMDQRSWGSQPRRAYIRDCMVGRGWGLETRME